MINLLHVHDCIKEMADYLNNHICDLVAII